VIPNKFAASAIKPDDAKERAIRSGDVPNAFIISLRDICRGGGVAGWRNFCSLEEARAFSSSDDSDSTVSDFRSISFVLCSGPFSLSSNANNCATLLCCIGIVLYRRDELTGNTANPSTDNATTRHTSSNDMGIDRNTLVQLVNMIYHNYPYVKYHFFQYFNSLFFVYDVGDSLLAVAK
jgi:hypothetical protein